METFIGILVGGAITFVASWWFYRRASEDLRQEARELKQATDRVARLLEALQGGHGFSLIMNEATGEVESVTFEVGLAAQSQGQVSLEKEIIRVGEQETSGGSPNVQAHGQASIDTEVIRAEERDSAEEEQSSH